jgi:pimeloyl-ACP methyl ester carboxylesterase
MLLSACATPAERLDEFAHRLGFTRQIVPGQEFLHVIYQNKQVHQEGLLHVYLDGDGTPWLNTTVVAVDPTPRNPLVLYLMAQDPAPSLYLGRPCYHGQSLPPCHPLLWTDQRYGPQVVDSMAAALKKMLVSANYPGIVFIGYSGGGTLAMLLAERFQQTRGVLTVAGNLDPERWAAWHGYSPLSGSLNPAFRPPLSPAIVQLHLVGGRDDQVPENFVQPVASRQLCGIIEKIETFDHTCCWQAVWPDILNEWQSLLGKKSTLAHCR